MTQTNKRITFENSCDMVCKNKNLSQKNMYSFTCMDLKIKQKTFKPLTN